MNKEQNLKHEDDSARLDDKPKATVEQRFETDLPGKRVVLNWIIMVVGIAAVAVVGKLLM